MELLAQTGAEWLALIVTCYQENIHSTEIGCLTGSRTPTDDDLRHAIQVARRLGLKVLLKPHLDLDDDPAHWRGEISFTEESDWQAWFASYSRFIQHYAQLAQAERVEMFCVGVELERTTVREADWREIVSRVRELYHGLLIYAANHSGEEFRIKFWDALDYIGVDAYYPLTDEEDPTVEELEAAWGPHLSRLRGLSARWGRPVIFTEIGYRSLDGTNIAPWDWQAQGPIDLQEQADCYLAFFQTFWRQHDWFRGVFWWAWSTDPDQGGPQDTGYTPHDKPAEAIIREFFQEP
ncbi:MAG: glycosyl hydrolase family 53 [Candidatus Acetothermia bacterium]|nr:glycosyl hydrolase family 53 [Candidatus Acetothermia bacterium]